MDTIDGEFASDLGVELVVYEVRNKTTDYRKKLLRVEPDEIAINEFTVYLIRVAATCSGKYERGICWEPSNYPISIGRVIVPGKKKQSKE